MEKQNKYSTILILCLGFVAFYFVFKIVALLVLALGIILLSLASVTLAEKIARAWFKLGHFMGAINSKILLSLVFYCLLVPIALISRIFKKKDELQLKRKPKGSYYKERNHIYVAEDLENVF